MAGFSFLGTSIGAFFISMVSVTVIVQVMEWASKLSAPEKCCGKIDQLKA